MTPQRRIHFAVLVEIRSHCPGTVVEIEEKDHAFADVDEQTYLAATSVGLISIYLKKTFRASIIVEKR